MRAPRIFESNRIVWQRQLFLVGRCACLLSLQLALIEVNKPLFTKQSAYRNHPEVNFGIVRVASVNQECASDFAGIRVEEVGHLFDQAFF